MGRQCRRGQCPAAGIDNITKSLLFSHVAKIARDMKEPIMSVESSAERHSR